MRLQYFFLYLGCEILFWNITANWFVCVTVLNYHLLTILLARDRVMALCLQLTESMSVVRFVASIPFLTLGCCFLVLALLPFYTSWWRLLFLLELLFDEPYFTFWRPFVDTMVFIGLWFGMSETLVSQEDCSGLSYLCVWTERV